MRAVTKGVKSIRAALLDADKTTEVFYTVDKLEVDGWKPFSIPIVEIERARAFVKKWSQESHDTYRITETTVIKRGVE